jgi:hypothetical protein
VGGNATLSPADPAGVTGYELRTEFPFILPRGYVDTS